VSASITARIVVVCLCFIGAATYLSVAAKAETIPPHVALANLPMAFDGWQGRREPDFTPDILAILGVDDYITRVYTRDGRSITGLYIGYHDSQRQGDTIHSPLNCLPGAGWQPLEQGRSTMNVRKAATAGPMAIEVNRVVIGKGLDRQLVIYWYQSHRRIVASEYWGKIYTVLDAVRYNRTDAALVRVVVPIAEGESFSSADKTASSFIESLFPLLNPHLPS
jgi:EpsI family protein